MSQKLTRRSFLVGVGALTVGALAACTAPAGPAQPGAEAPAADAAAPAGAKKQIGFSVWGAVQEDVLYTEVYIPQYEELHPDVEIEFLSIPDFDDYYDKLIQLHAAGTPIDVQRHNVQRLGQVTSKDMLIDMKPLYERDTVDTDDFLRGIMPAISREDGNKIYAIPQDENLHGLYYNLDLFDEAGLPYPGDDYTFDQLISDAHALTKTNDAGEIDVFGYISWWNWWNLQGHVLANGGVIFEDLRSPNEKVVVDDAWYQSLRTWKEELSDAFVLAPGSQQTGNLGPNVFFEQGRAALFDDGTWRAPFVKKAAPDLKFGVAPFPTGTVKKSRGSTVCWGVSTGSKELETAWDLSKYLYTPEALEAYWQILWVAPPARLSVVKSDAFKEITGLSSGGIDYPGIDSEEEWTRVEKWIVTTLENGWDTQESLGDGYSILQREMNAAIESVMVKDSTVSVEDAINTAVENTNREIELNR
jgi:multiple sugar transport system substrate-binding protein